MDFLFILFYLFFFPILFVELGNTGNRTKKPRDHDKTQEEGDARMDRSNVSSYVKYITGVYADLGFCLFELMMLVMR